MCVLSLPDRLTFTDVFNRHQDKDTPKQCEFKVTSRDHGQIHPSLTLGEVINLFGPRSFTFSCQTVEDEADLSKHASIATRRAIDAFQILMAGGGRTLPSKRTSR